MVKLWAYKVAKEILGTTLGDVPERYYNQVLDLLVEQCLFDEEGNRL